MTPYYKTNIMENNQNIPQQNHPYPEEDDIDLIALAKTLWESRKTIIKTTLIFIGIGLFIAIFSSKEFTTSTTFVPQTSDSKIGGKIGGLAAMAGINIGGMMNSDAGISPTLYPHIINSLPFQKELLQTPLTFEGQKASITYEDYYMNYHSPGLLGYLKKYTIGLPGIIIKAIKGEPGNVALSTVEGFNLQTITLEELELIEQLMDQIDLDVQDKDGYVTISANMPEAIASAELAYKAEELLQQYVIDFKIKKSKEQLEYIKERYLEIEEKFNRVHEKLASYKDSNKFITTALGNATLRKLQDEYDLIYGVYSELAKQLEAQYLQVTEDTPVFTVLKPVTIPIKRSKPKRLLILIISTLFGAIVGAGIVLGKEFIIDLRRKWNNIE